MTDERTERERRCMACEHTPLPCIGGHGGAPLPPSPEPERGEGAEDWTDGVAGAALAKVRTALLAAIGGEAAPDYEDWLVETINPSRALEGIPALAEAVRDRLRAASLEPVDGWIVSDRWGHDMEWHREEPKPDGIRGVVPVRIVPRPSDAQPPREPERTWFGAPETHHRCPTCGEPPTYATAFKGEHTYHNGWRCAGGHEWETPPREP